VLLCHSRPAGRVHIAGVCVCVCVCSVFISTRDYSRSSFTRRCSPFGLQAEFGDHEPDQPRPLDNVGQLTFAPNQNKEMEEKILELHKSHRSERTGSRRLFLCH